ncbi:MAG: thermonuclease family protein [Methyloceanibacter sp.]|nr:thermonuclease family protein [Methyloceanibacter sp.]
MKALVTLFLLVLTSPASAQDIHVVDGDTIEIGETIYRLYRIDAPEAGQHCNSAQGDSWPCGHEATALMEELVRGGSATCTARGEDDYGRTLAVCQAGGRELNKTMVERGLAWSFRRYAQEYDTVEDVAHEARIGVWEAETESPWDFRAKRWEVAAVEAPTGCPIKGNISREGERIYHAPWSPWYTRTRVNEKAGERWFCDEAAALAAGWRAPRWGR